MATNRIANDVGIAIGRIIKHEALVIDRSWLRALKSGDNPDTVAAIILADIIYWWTPRATVDDQTGAVVALEPRYSGPLLQRYASYYERDFGFSVKQVRRALAALADAGLIVRVVDPVVRSRDGSTYGNVPFVIPVPRAIYAISSESALGVEPAFNDQLQRIYVTSDDRWVYTQSGNVWVVEPSGSTTSPTGPEDPADDDGIGHEQSDLIDAPIYPQGTPMHPQGDPISQAGQRGVPARDRALYTQRAPTEIITTETISTKISSNTTPTASEKNGAIPNRNGTPAKVQAIPENTTRIGNALPPPAPNPQDGLQALMGRKHSPSAHAPGADARKRTAQALEAGIDARLYQEMTTRLLSFYGYTAAVEVGGDDYALARVQDELIAICKLGMSTLEKLEALIGAYIAKRATSRYKNCLLYFFSEGFEKDSGNGKRTGISADPATTLDDRATQSKRQLQKRVNAYQEQRKYISAAAQQIGADEPFNPDDLPDPDKLQ